MDNASAAKTSADPIAHLRRSAKRNPDWSREDVVDLVKKLREVAHLGHSATEAMGGEAGSIFFAEGEHKEGFQEAGDLELAVYKIERDLLALYGVDVYDTLG